MARKKHELIARVRFDPDYDMVVTHHCNAFVVEIYDEEYGWSLDTAYSLSESAKYPAAGCNFVDKDLVLKIFRLKKLGYDVSFCVTDNTKGE